MAYDRAKIFQQAKEAIEKHKLFFIDDIVAFLPIARSTFYDWELDKSDELKEMLDKNRVEVKSSLRSKWYKSNAPALQLALYKLIASPDEHRSLQMNYQDVTSEGKQVNVISLGTGKNPDEIT
jgi:hypothetical protein